MLTHENESYKIRLERVIKNELVTKIEVITGPQPESFVEYLIQHCKLITANKYQLLEESKSFEDGKMFFICSGITCAFYYDKLDNKAVIPRIYTKNETIFNVNSFQNKEDRKESIQMLEYGELLYIRYASLNNLLEIFPKMFSCMFWLHSEQEKYAIYYQHLLKLNVVERVKHYLNRNPGIMTRINNDHIAIHLGINRSTLSLAYGNYKQEKDDSKLL